MKALTQISAPGNRRGFDLAARALAELGLFSPRRPLRRQRTRSGFSLIELLVVVAIVAIAAAAISIGLRDPDATQLEREGERLVALLESARAEARAAGLTVRWQPGPASDEFRFLGLPKRLELPQRWLGEAPAVEIENGQTALVLGPEPLLPAQALRLRLGKEQLRIASDGLQSFATQPISPQ